MLFRSAHELLPEDVRDFSDPIKTSISFYNADKIVVSAGYAAEYICHFPVGNGRWFATPEKDIPAFIHCLANKNTHVKMYIYEPGSISARYDAIDIWR